MVAMLLHLSLPPSYLLGVFKVLPVGLLAAASARLPQPPPSVIPGDDQLAAFYRDVEEIKQ